MIACEEVEEHVKVSTGMECLRRSPRPPYPIVGWGGGHPLPIPDPIRCLGLLPLLFKMHENWSVYSQKKIIKIVPTRC